MSRLLVKDDFLEGVMRGYEQVGERMRERLVALGYVRADGEPDVVRFSFDYRFDKTHLYAWLRNTMTPFKDLIRLCTALECSVEWLLTGKEREMGKAHPRQGRGGARKLVLALSFGAAALWPSGGVSAHVPRYGWTPRFTASTLSEAGRKWRGLRAA